jgi:hypothetical protein
MFDGRPARRDRRRCLVRQRCLLPNKWTAFGRSGHGGNGSHLPRHSPRHRYSTTRKGWCTGSVYAFAPSLTWATDYVRSLGTSLKISDPPVGELPVLVARLARDMWKVNPDEAGRTSPKRMVKREVSMVPACLPGRHHRSSCSTAITASNAPTRTSPSAAKTPRRTWTARCLRQMCARDQGVLGAQEERRAACGSQRWCCT